jgi:intermediate filament protein if
LNERFASYLEKVRFLEAQNRKLADELEKLKSRWGKETTQIKAMYQAELDEARRLLDDAEKDKARLEIRCASLEEQLEEMRQKYVL